MSLAAVLTKPNAPLELREISWLQPEYGQVYVKILATGICGAQLQEIRGEKGSYFPRLLGHEAAVKVERVGPGVTKVKVGDLCVAHWRKGDGVESQSPRFRMGDTEYTSGQITTFGEYSVISENRLTWVPEYTPLALCSLLGCALSTALGTIENEANLKIGESVLIIGCGGLGLNLILAAKLRGASHIAVMDVENKSKMAQSMGATFFWNKCRTPYGDISDRLIDKLTRAFVHNHPFDVVIDTSGNPESISEGISFLGPSGRFISVGQARKPFTVQNPLSMFSGDGQSISATQGGKFNPSRDVPRYVEAYKYKVFENTGIEGLISHRFPLSEINEALELVRNGHAGRILIECEKQ